MSDDDLIDGFRAMREASQEKRKRNREASAKLLSDAGLKYESKNGGAHLVVRNGHVIADFWPGTGKYKIRITGASGRGVRNLISLMRPGETMSLSLTDYPEQKLDPPEPPELSESEERERSAAALRGLTNREIQEAIGDSSELASVLWIQVANHEASGHAVHPIDNELLGERIRDVVVPLLNRYVGMDE